MADQLPAAPLLIDAKAELPATPFTVERDGVKMYGITPQQWVFVQEYLASFNPYEAYARAFNCAPSVARHNGKRLLSRPEIARAIHDLLAEYGRVMAPKRDALLALAWREATNPENKATERLKGIEMVAKMTGVSDVPPEKDTRIRPVVNVTILGDEPVTVEGRQGADGSVAVHISSPNHAVLIEADRSAPILEHEPLDELDPEISDED